MSGNELEFTPKHQFNQDFYTLSTDYKELWDLIQKGIRVPAWIVYSDEYKENIWDLVEVKTYRNSSEYMIGTRGQLYTGEQTFEEFQGICQMYSLHFIP